MNLNDEQYERIARWLDGEPVELTEAERSAAEEIRRDEQALAPALTDVAVPDAAMARARMRMKLALGTTRRIVLRGACLAAGVAAAIALFVMLNPGTKAPRPDGSQIAQNEKAEVPVDVWVQSMERTGDGAAIDSVADELDHMEAEVTVSPSPVPMDRSLDALQQEINDFWLQDFSSPGDSEG